MSESVFSGWVLYMLDSQTTPPSITPGLVFAGRSLCYWCKALCTMAKKHQKKKPKLTVDVTAQEFAEIGAGIMNRFPGGSSDDFDTCWHAHFYAEPEVCAQVWSLLDIEDNLDAPDDRIAEPCHLLWCLLLLKTYETEPVLSSLCGGVDEDTFSKWAWHFIEKVSYLEQEVVSCFCLVE